jgi:hypothetical protein
VRTEANGVYLNREVDYIAGDILDGRRLAVRPHRRRRHVVRAGRVHRRGRRDGGTPSRAWRASSAYDLWDDEDGVIHFRPLGASAGVDDTLTPDYEYEIGIA